ncbi:nuclear transport factor 2 family protein [Rhizorhapis sp. SPR117]|uniref:nuclear transport factor 2 family protein n=1 Tax=Rhizorhapis sp. SPR117 TaxID=2912611 RepID=UPI001F2BCFC3|nr:nuclear transport factor 2 family protein [Rhizorhapis sp. SPR117]
MDTQNAKTVDSIAKVEIEDLLASYCRAINRCDDSLLRSVFYSDATVCYGSFSGPASEFCSDVFASIRSFDSTLHTIGNSLVEMKGDLAFGETYFVAFMIRGSGADAIDITVGGRYLDSFVWSAGRWWIRTRLVSIDWSREVPPTGQEKSQLNGGAPQARSDEGELAEFRSQYSAIGGPGNFRSESDPMAVARLIDQQEIKDVIMTYCRGIDRCDEGALRSIYHPGAVDEHGLFNGDAMEFCDYILPLVSRHITGMHYITTVVLESDELAAIGESYFIAYTTGRDENDRLYDRTIGGRYLDRFEKRESKWKIVHRKVVIDWNQLVFRGETGGKSMFDDFAVRGKHGKEDPLYAERERILIGTSG